MVVMIMMMIIVVIKPSPIRLVAQLTTTENTITYHNALCLSPQNFA